MADIVPPELASACPAVRPAGAQDLVCGQRATFVAEPASTEEAAALLRAAAALDLSVVPRGTGTRLDWGSPPRTCDLIVSTVRLDQVIEHAAGDLVVRVQAGLTLAALQERLGLAGQRLALDPPGGASIGGLLGSNVTGSLRFRYGAPRDLLIGITIIRADGTVAKAGGKVVKNVAGYDLGKLFAGSYGTLGLIADATFRLHPLPAASTWVTAETDDTDTAATIVLAAARSPYAPAAIELDWPSVTGPLIVSVLLEGDEPSVSERSELISTSLAGVHGGMAAGPFRVVRPRPGAHARHPAATAMRVAFWPGRLADVLRTIGAVATKHGLDPSVGGSAAAGVLEISLPAHGAADATAAFVTDLRAALATADAEMPAGSVVVLRAPADVRALVDIWGPVPSLDLMRAVKDQFDPGHRMAPGRFAGGI
jgi:glycolate oxidase FAD binding subunit